MIEKIKKNKIYIFIMFIIWIIAFIFVRNNGDYSITETYNPDIDGYSKPLYKDVTLSQDYFSIEDNLYSINLYCATYTKTIYSILNIKITDKETGEIIFDNNIYTENIEDNSSTPIYFPLQENSKGKFYNVTIKCIENNTTDGLSFELQDADYKLGDDVNRFFPYTYNGIADEENLFIKITGTFISNNIRIISAICLIVFYIITSIIMYMLINNKLNEKSKLDKTINILLIILFLCISIFWVFSNSFIGHQPDELMRIKMPFYIYNHNALPLPDDPEVISIGFNASYAYYPLYFGPLLGALFMKGANLIFGLESIKELYIAARFSSVLSGLIAIICLIKISEKLFEKDKLVKYLVIIIGGFIPQLIYLSSYYNSDILAVFSSSIILYSWIIILKRGWNTKRSLLLSLGIIICALSYYNAYGWILSSIFLLIFTTIKKNENNVINNTNKNIKENDEIKDIKKIETNKLKNKKYIFDYKTFWKYGLIIGITVLLFISYFFIRNFIVNDGDMLGMKSFLTACEEGGVDFQKPSNRDIGKNKGYSYWYMLTSKEWTNKSWIELTFKSFIGVFGPMGVFLTEWIYIIFLIIFVLGIIGNILKIMLKKDFKKEEKILYALLILTTCITIFLSMKYSYDTDYQPQGRYIYPAWISIIILIGIGLEYIINTLFVKILKKQSNFIKVLLVTLFLLFSVINITVSSKNITNFNFDKMLRNIVIYDKKIN